MIETVTEDADYFQLFPDLTESTSNGGILEWVNGSGWYRLNGSGSSGNGTDTFADISLNPWALVLIIFPMLTVFGNSLVVTSVVKEKSLRTATNYFIVSLATADIMVALLVMPLSIYVEVTGQVWELGDALCDAWVAFDVMCCTASILNLTAISVDRFIAVTRPIQYAKHKHSNRVFIMLGSTWLIAIAISSPIAFGMNYTDRRAETPEVCTFYNSDFLIYSSMGSFYIPCVVMILLYGRIFLAIRERARKAAQNKRPRRVSQGTTSIKPVNTELTSVVRTTAAENHTTQAGRGNQNHGSLAPIRENMSPRGSQLGVPEVIGNNSIRHAPTCPGASIGEIRELGACSETMPMIGYCNHAVDTAQTDDVICTQNHVTSACDSDHRDLIQLQSPGDGNNISIHSGYQSREVEVNIVNNVSTLGVNSRSRRGDPPPPPPPRTTSDNNHYDQDSRVSTVTPPSPARSSTNSGSRAQKLPDNKETKFKFGVKKKKKTKKAEKSSHRRERKATKTLAIVMGVFLFCWVPFFTINIMNAICIRYDLFTHYKACNIDAIVFSFFVWLGYMNSFLNPVIYTIFNDEFRRVFKKLLLTRCPKST